MNRACLWLFLILLVTETQAVVVATELTQGLISATGVTRKVALLADPRSAAAKVITKHPRSNAFKLKFAMQKHVVPAVRQISQSAVTNALVDVAWKYLWKNPIIAKEVFRTAGKRTVEGMAFSAAITTLLKFARR